MALMKYKDLDTKDLIEDTELFLNQLKHHYPEVDRHVLVAMLNAIEHTVFDACCKKINVYKHLTGCQLSSAQEEERKNAIVNALEEMCMLLDPIVSSQCPKRVIDFATVGDVTASGSFYYLNFLAFICPRDPIELLSGLKVCNVEVEIDQECEEAYMHAMVSLAKDIFSNICGAIK